jgi:hypothetical protein
MRLCSLYRREADRAIAAKAYLAGCVMIGAALESDLLAMCYCYPDEISEELIPKRKNGEPKDFLDWTFFQLLRVARECGWLPARLSPHEDLDQKRANVAEVNIATTNYHNRLCQLNIRIYMMN